MGLGLGLEEIRRDGKREIADVADKKWEVLLCCATAMLTSVPISKHFCIMQKRQCLIVILSVNFFFLNCF